MNAANSLRFHYFAFSYIIWQGMRCRVTREAALCPSPCPSIASSRKPLSPSPSAVVVAQFSREVVVIVPGAHSLSITVNLYKFSGCLHSHAPLQPLPARLLPPAYLAKTVKCRSRTLCQHQARPITFGPVNARSTQI